MFKTVPVLALALILSACGGGGGSDNSAAAAAAASPALSFSPAKLTGTFTAGTAFALNVTATATATRPADFNGVSNVYVLVVDDTGVIQSNAQVTALSTTQYSARVTTLTTLTAGTKTGNFSVRVCKDAACATQFPGSPVALPYELVVTAKP